MEWIINLKFGIPIIYKYTNNYNIKYATINSEFFTFKVVDEYDLTVKIYSHHMSLAMATDAKNLVALALKNGQIRFIDLNSGSFTHTIKAHPNSYCVCVQWSPYDSNILSSAG